MEALSLIQIQEAFVDHKMLKAVPPVTPAHESLTAFPFVIGSDMMIQALESGWPRFQSQHHRLPIHPGQVF